MADRIIGYPSNLTVVSAAAGGNVRVTYAPWELDWEWFDTMALVVNCLANVTTGVSVPITAKGGSEHLGYWFEIDQPFPSANWNTGNRIVPQRQLAINQHLTFAAAIAAMANGDLFLVGYQSTANRRLWRENCDFNGKGGGAWGILSRKQITIHGMGGTGIRWRGNQAGMNATAPVKNLTLISCDAGISFVPTAGFVGAGILVDRMRAIFCVDGIGTSVVAPPPAGMAFRNSEAVCCSGVGFLNIVNNLVPTQFCTSFRCNVGFGGNNNCINLLAVECVQDQNFDAVLTYCAGTATFNPFPVDPTNLRFQNVRTQTQLFYDTARPGNKAFPFDVRTCGGSVVRGRGLAIAGIPRDADGRLRLDPPSIGAYETYPAAYVPGSDPVRGLHAHRVGA